jgi:hypothetical protein
MPTPPQTAVIRQHTVLMLAEMYMLTCILFTNLTNGVSLA